MKKLIFLFTFAFIGQQVFSQMYIVYFSENDNPSAPCSTDGLLTIINPTGSVSYACVDNDEDLDFDPTALVTINIELNNIINQGYKLIETNSPHFTSQYHANGSTINDDSKVSPHTIWYFAVP